MLSIFLGILEIKRHSIIGFRGYWEREASQYHKLRSDEKTLAMTNNQHDWKV